MFRNLIVLVLIFIVNPSYSYDGTPKDQVKMFFKDFSLGKVDESIDSLYGSNPAMQQKLQALMAMKQQLKTVEALYGKYLGSENIHYEELSPSLVRVVEMAKHNVHPVIWEFYFYKPNKKWIVSQALYVDQFQNVRATK